MEQAVDAEAHVARLAPRLDMDVARALLERIVEEPVADVNDMLVVGIELPATPQLHQLLEVRDLAVCALVLRRRAFH